MTTGRLVPREAATTAAFIPRSMTRVRSSQEQIDAAPIGKADFRSPYSVTSEEQSKCGMTRTIIPTAPSTAMTLLHPAFHGEKTTVTSRWELGFAQEIVFTDLIYQRLSVPLLPPRAAPPHLPNSFPTLITSTTMRPPPNERHRVRRASTKVG